MSHAKTTIDPARALLLAATAAIILLATASPAPAHGGKEHGNADFTAFKALEKAAGLYNRLLSSGKLDVSWETGLENVAIAAPSSGGRREFVSTFRRSQGDPRSVYFFLPPRGNMPARILPAPDAAVRERLKRQ